MSFEYGEYVYVLFLFPFIERLAFGLIRNSQQPNHHEHRQQQTLKMGLERGLKERIPEIQEVIQSMPQGPGLEDDQINIVLDGVRPFLQVAGGSIDLDRVEGVDGLQPTIWLNMQGSASSLNSVKLEIAQRLQRHFMMPGLRVEWVGDNKKY